MKHETLFKDHYFFELSRKDALNAGLSLPAGLIGLLTGAIFAMSRAVSSPFSTVEIFLLAFLAASCISIVVATYFLVRVLWNPFGHKYRYMPLIHDLYEYKAAVVDFFVKKGHSAEDAARLASEKFAPDVDAGYANGAQFNCKKNDSKSANLFWAHTFVVTTVAFAMLAGFAYATLLFDKPSAVHRVEISNLKEISR